MSACYSRLSKHTGGVATVNQLAHGSENSADQAWALVASWSAEVGKQQQGWQRRGGSAWSWRVVMGEGIIQRFRPRNVRMPQCKAANFIDPYPCPRALVLDACHPGVVLRAVLAVATVLAVGALYVADSAATWLQTWACTGATCRPRWLVAAGAACGAGCRTCLPALQYALWVALGALAGLLACAFTAAGACTICRPWLAASAAPRLLAGALVARAGGASAPQHRRRPQQHG